MLRLGQIWWYRRRVPTALVDAIGQIEFVRSLRTPVYRRARTRAVLFDAQVERLFSVVLGAVWSEMKSDD